MTTFKKKFDDYYVHAGLNAIADVANCSVTKLLKMIKESDFPAWQGSGGGMWFMVHKHFEEWIEDKKNKQKKIEKNNI